ncbi:hypothetical protein ThidrDRAFT_2011 [Thiorhodococcus drewsii AZ1]|uniref:Uncharacterized protein n=1 Tax=Thiorhodococcus drewsii AZ1 TaxID=765913 RepID=G2E148_9GAMM|nr:hypothetical protein [Thiorhodococcus drewsii]EGV31389.1 hypothetical protein ThidrDRAFT_2011 [Thiorhodococcus drewsii AZ1]
MQQIKKTAEYTLFQKKSGRYAVKDKNKQWISGEAKQQILVDEKLITLPEPKAAPEPETEASEAE